MPIIAHVNGEPRTMTVRRQSRAGTPIEGDRVSMLVYIYPERNPLYQQVMTTIPPSRNQAMLKFLLTETWEEACTILEAFRRNDQEKIQAWRALHGIEAQEGMSLPVPDLNNSTVREPYTIFVRRSNETHQPIISYYEHLAKNPDRPTPAERSLRQLFLRLVLAISASRPDLLAKAESVR